MKKAYGDRASLNRAYQRCLRGWEEQLSTTLSELEFTLRYGHEVYDEPPPAKYLYTSGRIKSFDSLYAKARAYKIPNPLREMYDLIGIRIVCLYRNDIQQIAADIARATRSFEITPIPKREPAQNSFGYEAEHYRLVHNYVDHRRYRRATTTCELQIRTILMDAWASLSHDLDYKKSLDIPAERRRDFYALAAALYSLDTQFDALRAERENYGERLLQELVEHDSPTQLKLNHESFAMYIKLRFPEIESPYYVIDIMVPSLLRDGIETIQLLDHILKTTADAVNDPEFASSHGPTGALFIISVLETSLLLYEPELIDHHFYDSHLPPNQNRRLEHVERLRRVRERYSLSDCSLASYRARKTR